MLLFMVAMIAAAKDFKTVVFTTKNIKTDVEAQKVYITFDPKKTTEVKLQKAFEKFGYKAEKTDNDSKIPSQTDKKCENM